MINKTEPKKRGRKPFLPDEKLVLSVTVSRKMAKWLDKSLPKAGMRTRTEAVRQALRIWGEANGTPLPKSIKY